MSASKKKRLVIVGLGTLAAAVLYLGAYFACISIEFRYAMRVGAPSLGSARPYYKVGPISQDFAQSFFEPARLFDAYYLRPKSWADKYRD
jgi:hypothetical protein